MSHNYLDFFSFCAARQNWGLVCFFPADIVLSIYLIQRYIRCRIDRPMAQSDQKRCGRVTGRVANEVFGMSIVHESVAWASSFRLSDN